ncbi:class I SAM-dependent methyltransferase [Sutcliffiella rhizosphaerae]|uniref:Ribosomal RNA small subunit methyltransferase C n=1 Tax=Sutcliffiella rhizosphaerae TaxID=2880967 RepID=A0ABM8YQE6_9BACI|nr:class I SAM-dependent methyltransferase [Sutcliffiella rhizosphaerae]CAG9622231.1 Ribosomal RNA small subunit methyltransferase C [Sutcliffiella rhizosphaerae]
MTNHYYTNKPSVESNRQQWSFDLKGHQFSFTTDTGVFSKKEVDFGSRVLIDAFELPEVEGCILDVGCGYGPIGLSIAKGFPDREVHMVDVNERAVELAKENAAVNKVENVSVFISNIYENVTSTNYAAILSNPPIRAGKKVVHEILEKAWDHLMPNGELWIVIQKKQGAPSAIAKLESLFEDVEVVVKKKGYLIIKSKKG